MKHGHRAKRRSSITYTSWRMMIQRCYNKNHKSYEDYGGRGIKVYFDWMGPGGFAAFLQDVGKRPSRKHTLDRIDSRLGYEPGNVRWATKSVQNSNKSGFIYELNGERFTIYERAAALGLHPGALRKRLSRGMSKEIAFTKPNARRARCGTRKRRTRSAKST